MRPTHYVERLFSMCDGISSVDMKSVFLLQVRGDILTNTGLKDTSDNCFCDYLSDWPERRFPTCLKCSYEETAPVLIYMSVQNTILKTWGGGHRIGFMQSAV
jgi:hypothetical protein